MVITDDNKDPDVVRKGFSSQKGTQLLVVAKIGLGSPLGKSDRLTVNVLLDAASAVFAISHELAENYCKPGAIKATDFNLNSASGRPFSLNGVVDHGIGARKEIYLGISHSFLGCSRFYGLMGFP